MQLDSKTYTYSSKKSNNYILIFLGLVLLIVNFVLGSSSKEFYFSYLTSYFFWLSILLGGIFFTLVHHGFSATWSTVIRRVMENIIILMPVFTLLFFPIVVGMDKLFIWMPSHELFNATDHLLQVKEPFLNEQSFLIRFVLYFSLWNLISISLYKMSVKHDSTGDHSLLRKMNLFSMSPLAVLFFVSLTFVGFDLLMSLDPHWYSTMFGVYIFAGSFLVFLAVLTFTLIRLQDQGYLNGIVSKEHYHDLGKYLFAFTVFYCYIAGAQFYFIWYSNIPEETIWYLHRWVGTWKIASVLLIFGKFVVPFFTLVFRASKRNTKLLKVMTLWIIAIHYLDIHWIVMPTIYHHDVHLGAYDLFTMLGFTLVFVGMFKHIMSKNLLVPINDPELKHAINHRNSN
ncbi:MAG: hypothetical protein VX176_02080 [Candidatus Neomarinimicrobiota bacterium]|nr:hypothetical protein [Candidatus Neomarinimicrobiota bacterium]MEC9455733.1 hypothetical protein [Candidatus Neomarinimicrobiota bacterium]MEE3301840.1 hypothetical protein [Candidatus Neomarinimicrobiota bacterium]